ncbi:hypothetical protein EJB05_02278 [Eragrostis curvula]|uniref:Uncharacterized protein n=1 Tax=Eragrostis curvula TaxID=38414 RepID=A0A5J9WRV6_9POAL|nr:hypothetical protein EJB05_02278 [Eragrostis curvula]
MRTVQSGGIPDVRQRRRRLSDPRQRQRRFLNLLWRRVVLVMKTGIVTSKLNPLSIPNVQQLTTCCIGYELWEWTMMQNNIPGKLKGNDVCVGLQCIFLVFP